MRLLPVLILLGFPILELYVLARLSDEIGWWTLVWLVCSTIVGITLVRDAGLGLSLRLAHGLRQGKFMLSSVMDSGRVLIAGLLFIFPGVISDALAICLLLLPFRINAPRQASASVSSDGIIEGEFRQIEERNK